MQGSTGRGKHQLITGNWQEFDSDGGAWDGLSGDDPLPLQQSWAYGEAMSEFGAQPLRLVCRRDGGVVASAQLVRNKLFGLLKPAVCFRGPLWHGLRPDDPAKSEMLAELKAKFPKRKFEVLLAMPEEASSPEAHQGMRRAGFRRIMTGYSIHLDGLGRRRGNTQAKPGPQMAQ